MGALKRPGFGVIVSVLILAEIVSAFELSMMYVTLPTLIKDFQVDANTVAWVVTAYLLVSASAGVMGGRFGDMYGRRKVMVVVLVIAGAGSLVSLIGGSLGMIILGRAIQGVAGAVMGLAFGLAREHLDEERIPVGVSMIGASALIAGAGGAFIAGFMIDVYSWHGIFAFAAVLAGLAAVAVFFFIPRDNVTATTEKPDYLGSLLLPIAVSAILLGLSSSSKVGFDSIQFIGLMGIGILVALVWVWWELRVESPIVNLRMFKNRQIALVMTATILAAIGPIGGMAVPSQMVLQYPASVSFGLGFTATAAGIFSCVTALLGYFFSPLGGTAGPPLRRTFGVHRRLGADDPGHPDHPAHLRQRGHVRHRHEPERHRHLADLRCAAQRVDRGRAGEPHLRNSRHQHHGPQRGTVHGNRHRCLHPGQPPGSGHDHGGPVRGDDSLCLPPGLRCRCPWRWR